MKKTWALISNMKEDIKWLGGGDQIAIFQLDEQASCCAKFE